ncbi:hypothetical protein [Phenylobacterium sp.]|uniref:hypothetical protein n=1 Tax=Phenylobacterium sp. TaxID=1871053 RepID=UPI0026148788|nr:hypothetical protein [Phenylobacterium sp.]
MTINVIGIATAAAVTNVNLVLEAMGRGPGNISRKATTVANPAWDATPTHYFMSDQGVTPEFQAQLLGFANGDLPPLPEGVVWGEEGVISAADALAAIASPNFSFASFSGAFTPGEQVQAALDALGLHVIPFPEI